MNRTGIAVILFGALAFAAGCADSFAVPDSASVPDKPTWENSVKRVMDNHCNNCHGAHPNHGAPRDFRLDSYLGDSQTPGARDMAGDIVATVKDGSMPPESPLGPHDTEILQRWLDQGTPEK